MKKVRIVKVFKGKVVNNCFEMLLISKLNIIQVKIKQPFLKIWHRNEICNNTIKLNWQNKSYFK